MGVRFLDGISKSLPEQLWLDRLNVSGKAIAIDGRAMNTNAIANFVERMDKLRDFGEPTLRSTELEPDKTYRFSISLGFGGSRSTDRASSQAELDSLLRGLASQDEVPKVLQRLRSLLGRPGIKVKKFEPLPLSEQGNREQIQSVEIRVGAESYGALTRLFDGLDRFLPIVALTWMDAARDKAKASFLAVDLRLAVPVLRSRAGGPGEARKSDGSERVAFAAPLREPFQVLTRDEAARPQRLGPSGVPGLRIADLELRGIFRTSKGYVAQVRSREQIRDYLLKEGDELFDGEVVHIGKDEAVFRRAQGDAEGPQEVTLRLKSP
ncbi:MAG: PilN domain-containing protein [Thermoanaerobaculia bacterium]